VSLVVGHDRWPASQSALTFAVDLAARLPAHLHVVHVVNLSDYPVDPDAADWEDEGRRELETQRAQVRAFLDQFGDQWSYHSFRGIRSRR